MRLAKQRVRSFCHLKTAWGIAVLMTGLFLSFTVPAWAAPAGPTISLMIDGKGIETDVAPLIVQRRMFVPLRAIAEHTGAEVEYAASTGRVTLKTPIHSTAVFIGNETAYKDGQKYELDAAPQVKQGRTMVPVRFVSEALG